MKSVSDLGDLSGKRVLIRCDLNVPLDGQTITDDGRIRASLPTLNELRDRGAKIIVLAHLGRPKGQANPKYSLAPAAQRLSELLGAEVKLAQDVVGESAQGVVSSLADGEVGMLENVRYEPGEESKDDSERVRSPIATPRLAMCSSRMASVWYTASRLRCTTSPSDCRVRLGAGQGGGRSARAAHRSAAAPVRGGAGGAKVSDKLAVIANLIKIADTLVIGGGMAFTFLASEGYEVGKSLLEADQIKTVRGYLNDAASGGKADRAALRHRGRPGGCRRRPAQRCARQRHPG
jgi:phosphoglycerate kinase